MTNQVKEKIGGGNKPQDYDPENGQYVDEQKHSLEDQMKNIVFRYIFGDFDTYDPFFPVYGFHDEDYCDMYVTFALKKPVKYFPEEKVTKYLLVWNKSGDKSNFFRIHGYSLDNRANELYDQILKNSDMSKRKFNRFTSKCLSIEVPTKIFSYKYNKNITIKTIWRVTENGQAHFITVVLEKGEKYDY